MSFYRKIKFNLKHNIMKTTTIFQKTAVIFAMFVFTVFAFNACSSDDDSDDPPTPPIAADALVGTWNAVSMEANGSGTVASPWGNASYTATGVGSNLNCNLVITENPNNITSNGTYDMVVHVNVSHPLVPSYTDTFTDLPFSADGTWSRSGADLSYIINDADIKEGTIILNDNDRQLVITFNETHGAVNLDVEVTFARQ